MTIRLNVQDQLSPGNNAWPEDQTSDPWITNPILIEQTFSLISEFSCQEEIMPHP